MASPRLAAFLDELEPAMRAHRARAEALILRVPGEGAPALDVRGEAAVLLDLGERLGPAVEGWVLAVQDLARAEGASAPPERASEAARAFGAATAEFLTVWDGLLRVKPATEPMRRVVALVHQGCYELFLSGPEDLWRSCRAIVEGRAEPSLHFAPSSDALEEATRALEALHR